MKVGDYTSRLRGEALHCPVRGLCPFAFLCGTPLNEEKFLLPVITDVESHEMVWTDLGARRQVYVVRSGMLINKSFANGGEEIPMALFSAGCVVGMPDIFTPYVASDFYFFLPVGSAQVCCFDGDLVKERIEGLGAGEALALAGRISLNQTTAIYGQTLTTAHRRGRERVASVLLRVDHELSRQPGFSGVLPITHDMVAFLARIERATASRELKSLARDGLIDLGYRRVAVLPPLREAYGAMIEANLPFYNDAVTPPAPPA